MARAGSLIATLFFAVTFFSVGEAAFEAHVNYPAWLLISDDSFGPYHREITARIPFLLVPIGISMVLNVLLLWRRPPSIPLWSLWATLGLQLLAWLSTAFIQIPIQRQLGAGGYSRELLERLIWTDLLYRKLPSYVRLAVAGWMLHGVVEAGFGSVSRRREGA